jgi:hypothetical protein
MQESNKLYAHGLRPLYGYNLAIHVIGAGLQVSLRICVPHPKILRVPKTDTGSLFQFLLSSSMEKWLLITKHFSELQALTIDVIGRCAFGVDSDALHDRNDEFYVNCRKFFLEFSLDRSWAIMFGCKRDLSTKKLKF